MCILKEWSVSASADSSISVGVATTFSEESLDSK
jgi:hypothetical protein